MKKLTILIILFTLGLGTIKVNAQIAAPSICMVTVDDSSHYNVIYWDNAAYTYIDSFIVYREVSPGSYTRIGAQVSDSLSMFVDTARSIGPANGDPNLASYSYKLQMRDSAGVLSYLSPYHSTIYITDAGSGQFDWSIPYTIEGAPNPVHEYKLLCDTANIDYWTTVNSVDSNHTSATDPGFLNHSSIANWRIKTDWNISCTPSRASVNTTRSNIKHAAATVGIKQSESSNTISIYPNPAKEMVTIEVNGLRNQSVKIMNVLGEVVYQSLILNPKSVINISSFAKGIYTVEVDTNNGKSFKKLVVQ